MSIKGQTYKKYNHPYRAKMIQRVCVEIYKLKEEEINEEIINSFNLNCYKEIIKPLVYKERNFLTEGELQNKYQLSRQEIKTIIMAADYNIKIYG